MEIRDPVHGNIILTEAEEGIINTIEFQRLRAIKQLGFAEFSFPGATHNRFLHSIGVSHLTGLAFDRIFSGSASDFPSTFLPGFHGSDFCNRLKRATKLAALLHDLGHGPLSHTIENVMPLRDTLWPKGGESKVSRGRATHEDYTLKYILESPVCETIQKHFSDIPVEALVSLLSRRFHPPGDFFKDSQTGLDFHPLLSQLVTSELDCDRMDYLERDSYFCGTNYGKLDLHWLINNMTLYPDPRTGKVYLALNRRALYTFDDFLISRHHMHLMVYFHHKSVVYEELLNKYFSSPDCDFHLPSQIEEYTKYDDYSLFENIRNSSNEWARRIAERRPFRVLIEIHMTGQDRRSRRRLSLIRQLLDQEDIGVISASSEARLSRYSHQGRYLGRGEQIHPIFVVDQYDRWDEPVPIDRSTEIFQKYKEERVIERLYVAPEDYERAERFLLEMDPGGEDEEGGGC